jgi:hypothetical protein
MKKGTVHFTLGDDAGKLLMQIAQEALLYELDPEKAIKVITTSLMGCPDNIALKILKGDMVCVVMDDKQTIDIATYDRFLHKDFPRPNLSSWYERNHKEIGDTAREYYRALEQIARFVQKQKLEIPIKDVVAVVLSATMKDWETFRGKLSHMEDVERIVLVVNQCTKFLDRAAKLYRVFDFIDAVYPDVSCDLSRGRHNVVSLLQIRLSAIISGELCTCMFGIISVYSWRDDDINALKEIDVLVDCGANEELFLAIAALRDDTDKYQWFTDGDLWFKCGDEVCNEGRKIHKATVNELIEHFKIKEEQ